MHPIPEPLTRELEAALTTDWNSPDQATRRAALFVSLGLYGLRLTEARNLRRYDLDATAPAIYIRSLKGGRPRRVPLHRRFAETLTNNFDRYVLPAALARGDAANATYLLPSLRGARLRKDTALAWATRYLAHYGPYSFHSLRHTAAIRIWTETRDVLAVMRFLGHRSLRHTQVYLQTIEPTDPAGLPEWRPRKHRPTPRPPRGRPRNKPQPTPPTPEKTP